MFNDHTTKIASPEKRAKRRLASGVSGLAMALTMAGPAVAQVVEDRTTNTVVNTNGGLITVTTSTIRGTTAFNSFSRFDVNAGEQVDLVQPDSAQALVNVIRQGSASTIAGTVRALKGGTVGGNAYFVNADGFMVTGTGAIRAGRLTMSAPSAAFVNDLHAEAAGTGTFVTTPTAQLFAGTEALDGGGPITFEPGSQIDATRLDLRAGARLILGGSIIVRDDTASGTIAPAVNLEGKPAAAGVAVDAATGVIRLFAEGEMDLGGTMSAQRGPAADKSGGLIEAILIKDNQNNSVATLDISATFDVSGVGSGAAGAITLFSEGTAATDPALTVNASADAGSGGFFSLDAAGDVTRFTGDFEMDGSGANGVVTAVGQNVSIDGDISTQGGDLGLAAVEDMTVAANSRISTRADGSFAGDAPTGTAGDLVLAGENVTIATGTTLRADSADADGGGIVAITARNVSTGILWNFVPEDEIATVEITGSDIKGGSVVVTALARAQNVLQSDDEAQEEQLVANNLDAVDNAGIVEGLLTNTTQLIEDIFARGIQTAVDLLPVQVRPLNAEATVRITDSTVVADGNWTDRDLAALTPDMATDFAENGQFAATGLRENTYRLIGGTGRGVKAFDIALPTAADLSQDSLVVQSHGATSFNIAPKAFGLGVAVAVTDTNSRTIIDGTSLTTTAGDIHLASTAFEDHTVSIAAKKVANVAAALVVTVRDLENQLLTTADSTISSAADLDAAAWTGKAHSTNTLANGGQDGRVAGVVSVSVSNALTEAAFAGEIGAAGNIDLDAETLYFNLARSTTGTLGVANVMRVVQRQVAGQLLAPYSSALAQTVQGKQPMTAAKEHFGMAFAVDVQLDDDNTYATIGGQYRDLDNGGALTDLGAATVTANTGTVSLDATTRFASRIGEGGGTLSRSTSAAFGKITAIQNAVAASVGINPDDLLGNFDQGLMLNASVGLMLGETRAEIGKDALVTADTVNVRALTRYPNADPFVTIADQWDTFTTDLANYQPLDPDAPNTDVQSSAPQLLDLINPLTYLTTETKAKATAPSGENSTLEEQKLAFGVTVDVFNTDNVTEAVIAEGAVVNATSAVTVDADQESLFLHIANLPKSNPTSIKAGDFIGAAIIVSRTASRVSAVVESGATINLDLGTDRGDLSVDANTRNIGGMLPFSGGGGRQTAINATIGARISEMETEARIGDNARITAGDVDVTAKDSSMNWVVAGAVSTSENVGVGASGAVNFATRRVYAGIAPDVDANGVQLASTAAEDDVVLDAETLDITATNDTLEVTVTLAGAKVQDGKPTDPPADQQDQDDKIIPDWLFADEEQTALNQQNNVDTPEDSNGQSQKSGWAVAGAASVNLMLGNVTAAEIVSNGDINLDNSLSVTATNSMVVANVGGAVAASTAKAQNANALAGAFAVNVDTRELRARIRDAQVTVTDGAATVSATDSATVANIAVGGAGTSRGSIALAGSVAVSVLDGGTEADIDGATIISDDLTLTAVDRSTTVSVGGAVGVNMSANEGAGVGIGIAVNTVTRGATARLRGASVITTDQLTANATSDQSIYGFGISAGVGKTGISGSVTVNTITSGAQAGIFDTGSRVQLNATGVGITATETNTIFALSGALAGGRQAAVGAAVSVNVIVADTKASLAAADVAARAGGDLGLVRLMADADSTITSIAVAGGASANGTAAGAGISANVITADAVVDAAGARVTDAAAFDADADANRTIAALAGAVAGSSGSAGGAGATLNLIIGNTTKVILDDATISTRTGALTANALSTDTIRSLAAAISASGGNAISGGIAVNIITGTVGVSANDAALTSGAALTLDTKSEATIESLSGGAAIGGGGNAVGAAISANFISQDVVTSAARTSLTSTDAALQVTSTSDATIAAIAVGLSGGSSNAVSGSVAIGDIGNKARVDLGASSVDAGTAAITIGAEKTDAIEILSGSVAGSGSNAVGGAITVALIHGAVTADLVTASDVTGSSLSLNATNTSTIDAIAVAGSGSGNVAVSGSIVYTQIGRPAPDGASIAPMPGPSSEDPAAEAQSTIQTERDEAVADLAADVVDQFGSRTAVSAPTLNLDTDDITRARLELTGATPTLPITTINATETSTIRSLAGGGAGGGVGGFGAGFAINLLFGKTEAEIVVADDSTVDAEELTVSASQTGSVETAGVAAGIGGSAGGAGSVALSILDREVDARISGAGTLATRDTRADTKIATGGEAVSVTATQSGTLSALAGAVAISGGGSGGGAVVVNVLSDDAEALIEDVSLDLRADATDTLAGAGTATVTANQSISEEALAAAAGGGATGAFAGSFAINVADGEVLATVRRGEILASSITASSVATNTLTANAGAVAADGGASVGLSVSSNTTAQTVRTNIASATLLSDGNIVLVSDASTGLSGNAVAGAFSGGVAVTGSGVGNAANNTVETLVTAADNAEESIVIARGSVFAKAHAVNTVTLLGGADEKPEDDTSEPGLNLQLSGGGAAGIGASATVNLIENTIEVRIDDQSVVTGLGRSTVDAGRLGVVRGVALDAYGATGMTMVSANGAAGGIAAVTGLFSFNIIDDSANVVIGSGTRATSGAVNSAITLSGSGAADIGDILGATSASAGQRAVIDARVFNDIENYSVALAIGGSAGVGVAAGTTLVTSKAGSTIDVGSVVAQGDVAIEAEVESQLDNYVIGAGGGFVGVAGSAGVNIIRSEATVDVTMGEIRSFGGNLSLATLVDTDTNSFVGSFAGGVVAAGGAVQVNVLDSTSRIRIARAQIAASAEGEDRDSFIDSDGDVTMAARTEMAGGGEVAAGSAGSAAIGLSANVTLAEATTEIDIDDGQKILAGGTIDLSAQETLELTTLAGAVAAAGSVGVGASLDYARISGSTKVIVGDDTTLQAGTDLRIGAVSVRRIDSTVAVGSVGGIAAVTAAIGVVEMGGAGDDPDGETGTLRGQVDQELNAEQSTGGGLEADQDESNSAEAIASYAGGDATRNRAASERAAVDVSAGPGADVVRVEIGSDASLEAENDIVIDGVARTRLVQKGGGVAGGFVGVVSGTNVATVSTGAVVEIKDNAEIKAGGDLRVSALTGGALDGTNELDAIEVDTLTVGGGAVAAGVGVAVAKLDSRADVLLGSGARLSVDSATDILQIVSARSERINVEVDNLVLSGIAGVGAVVVNTRNEGQARIIRTGTGTGPTITGGDITLSVTDSTSVQGEGTSASGGLLGSGNGVDVRAKNLGTTQITLTAANITGMNVSLSNTFSGRSRAVATGAAVAGGLAVGGAFAEARTDATVGTTLSGDIRATRDVTVRTRIDDAFGINADAEASSSSGALIGGNGAEARALIDYDVTADFGGTMNAGQTLSVFTDALGASARADANGRVFGGVAIGATIAEAGQSDERTGVVSATFDGLTMGADTIDLAVSNAPDVRADALSGSGGLVAGSGAENTVRTGTVTTLSLGAANASTFTADLLTVSALQNATVAGRVDTTSASAVGVSGARSRSDHFSDVDLVIGGDATLRSRVFKIGAGNAVNRPRITENNGFNVQSGSGGVVDAAAMQSTVDVTANTDLTIATGANLEQQGIREEELAFEIGVSTEMNLTDRMKLDSGGAIAVPVGNSFVRVNTNTANVTIGDADIFASGILTVYAGSDSDLYSEVDTKTYGLAGAGVANTEATFNAVNQISVGDGARIESLNDIVLQAGHVSGAAQDVNVTAESRVFNKTAIPIPTDPAADAKADTSSLLTIADGAEVIAVRDVSLFADDGGRNVRGYGRGKDLYREALAEIGSAISNAFGGDDVSLDIESGTSTDISTDVITVNGYVRAGSRNKQILILDGNNNVDNPSIGEFNGQSYTNEDREGIEFTVLRDQSIVQDIQERISELDQLLNNTALADNDAAAEAAWQAERAQLVARLPAGNPLRDEIHLGPIVAQEGDIFMRGDSVIGAGTGILEAPGDALVLIQTYSDATIVTDSIVIPDEGGARIFFNDTLVSTPEQVGLLSRSPVGPYDFTMISGANGDEPLIQVEALGTLGTTPSGSVVVDGPLANFRGTVRLLSRDEDIDVRADIDAKTVDATAGRDFIQGFSWGFTEVDGSPDAIYASRFRSQQDAARALVFGGLTITSRVATGDFTLAPREGRIRAGRNVYISADKLNINGLIQAGTGQFDVTLNAGLGGFIDDLDESRDRILLHDPLETDSDRIVKNPDITSDVPIYYNTQTDRIEIDPMIVQGGKVVLTGNILSTGAGRIQSLDGFGVVNVTNNSGVDIQLNRVDLGPLGEASGGVEGLVRITDTNKTVNRNGETFFLTTDYRRIGNELRVLNNETVDIETVDYGETQLEVLIPSNLVRSVSGRTEVYQPTLNRDYITITGENVSQTTDFIRKDLVIIGISGTTTEEGTPQAIRSTQIARTDLGQGPYLGASLPGADYAYAFEGRAVSGPTNSDRIDFRKTHDSVEWWKLGSGWRHYEWEVERTAQHLYTHRLKADYPVEIVFGGADVGSFDVTSNASVFFGDTVSNFVGNTSITASAGDILTTSQSVVFESARTILDAINGRIGGLDGSFRFDQTDGATLTARAATAIDIRELQGDMLIDQISTTARNTDPDGRVVGAVKLRAEGSIAEGGSVSGNAITASDLTIISDTGAIGTAEFAAFGAAILDTSLSGKLTATAREDIAIRDNSGDLGLVTVTSALGGVSLYVPNGALLDRNDIEVQDLRTEGELTDLYVQDLALNGDGLGAREQAQIDALKAERERLYATYWDERTAAGGTPVSYTIDPAVAQGLLDGGWTQSQLDTYIADREALYTLWNGDAARDPNYAYTPTADETAALLAGIEWTAEQLTRSLKAGLIRGTADTSSTVEDPNIVAAGDIRLDVLTEVGELKDPYLIPANVRVSAEDLRVLNSAERTDLTVQADGSVLIQQSEELDFAFTSFDAENRSVGRLFVTADNDDIFLASETAASLGGLSGDREVRLKVDGAMTDARTGQTAVRGQLLVLESGNNAAIGEASNPLTVELLANGSLVARGGTGVFIDAPLGDLPIGEVFSGGSAVITARGAITDVVGSGVPRLLAADITMRGGSIGTDAVPFIVSLSDTTTGRIDLETTAGDAFVTAAEMPLERVRLAAGGRLTSTGTMALTAEDTIVFGTGSTLQIVTAGDLDLTGSSGVDIAGGTLVVASSGSFGNEAKPLQTTLVALDYTGEGAGPTPLIVRETDDLRIASVVQPVAASVTDITALGDISVGTIEALGLVRLNANAITDGRIVAGELRMRTASDIGGTSRMDITAGHLFVRTTDGNATMLLRDRATAIEAINLGGDGALSLTGSNAPVTLLSGSGISTQGGVIDAAFTSLLANADISSNGGNMTVATLTNLVQTAGTQIDSGTGTVLVDVGGDLTVSRIVTQSGAVPALSVLVDGTVDIADGETGEQLVANTAGAQTLLRFGSLQPEGPEGLKVRLAQLDGLVGDGPVHLQEADDIWVESLRTTNGQIDLFAGGDIRIDRIVSDARAPVTVSALGDLTADGGILSGGDVRLFAFEGAIRGVTGDTFTGDTDTGTTVYLYARDDVDYLETAGDLRAGFAISETGDLQIDAASGALEIGVIGAGGDVRLDSTGSMTINTIGNAIVDLAPEEELALVRPEYYGRKEAPSPSQAWLSATGEGAEIRANMISVKDRLILEADVVDVNGSDKTPDDGLLLTVRGGFAEYAVTDVDVFEAGMPLFMPDPFESVLPRLDPTATSEGKLTLIEGRIGSGELTHQGQELAVEQDSRIGGDVWFRQRSFDVLATITYRELDTFADAQVFDPFDRTLALNLSNEINLVADDTLVLNRRLGGVGVNGGQGFNFEVGVESGIRSSEYVRGEGEAGTAFFIIPGFEENVVEVRLPLITATP